MSRTRADRGDWDMHPSDAEPEEIIPDAATHSFGSPPHCRTCGEHGHTEAEHPRSTDSVACMTQRRARSIEDEMADDAADAYETDFYRRSE